MHVENTSWDSLALEFRFALKDFDKKSFLRDLEIDDKKGYAWLCGSSKQPDKQHAHLGIKFLPNKRGELSVLFHKYNKKVKDIRPPYMEDCVQWIGQFFRIDEMRAEIETAFVFDNNYSPIIALPFPLLTESRELAGALVSGLNIELPRRTKIRSVTIQYRDGSTIIIGTGETKIGLKSFDLDAELSKLSTIITKLVKKREKVNDSR